jgi:DNA repair protein RecN (Recombination protein N)
LKSLKIQNLILVEKAEIVFGPNLNILTGETGSGKSAILSAIRLLAGGRADASCIRKGADFAVVEALNNQGEHIRREIYRSGKNRCFIDDAQVTLAEIKQKIDIEMVDQSSSHLIFESGVKMLDDFAHLLEEVSSYEDSFKEQKKIEAKYEKYKQIPKEKELAWALKDLEMIEEVNFQAGEEEKLVEEHHFLTHAQELAEKMSQIAFTLTESQELPVLKNVLTSLEQCIRFDAKLAPLAQSMKSGLLELQEVAHAVSSYSDRLQIDPNRLSHVEKRIASIEALKRRFGTDIAAAKEKLESTIETLSNLDAEMEEMAKILASLEQKNLSWLKKITEKRKEAASVFSLAVLQELKSLNIPHAKFEVHVGEALNDVYFLFSANAGIKAAPLEQCASGGELSRLLLAIKTILVHGDSTLVFDEIDSNVGGQTATILGEKLKKLAQKRQVICVTHFVQVAKCATDHFLVAKVEKENDTVTTVRKLNASAKEEEYNRMLGKVS